MDLEDIRITRNFEFPLNSQLWKQSIEYTSLATLKYCFKSQFQTLIHADAPDLQDKKNKIGIEVTKFFNPNNDKIVGEFVKLNHTEDIRVQQKAKEKILKCGGGLPANGFLIHKARTNESEIEEIEKAIEKKTTKLEKYQNDGFSKLGLYLYADTPLLLDGNDVYYVNLIRKIKLKYTNFYDFIFINGKRRIIYIDCKDFEMSSVAISNDDTNKLDIIGRMAAEGIIKDDDIIWGNN